MPTSRFCAFNKTRGVILSLDVAVLDAAMDPLRVLRVLMEGLSSEPSTGLWVTHFKAVPVARAVCPFDLIYLDKSHCVVHAAALTVDSAFEPFEGEPSSALVLPSSIIGSSRTESGDQLVIVAAPESVRAAQVETMPPIAVQPVSTPPVVAAPLQAEALADAALARYLSGNAHLAPSTTPAPAASPTPAIEPAHTIAPPPAPIAEPVSVPVASAPAATPLPVEVAAMATVPPPVTPESPAIEYYQEPPLTLRSRVLRWLQLEHPVPQPPHRIRDRRRAYRLNRPDLIAYFFTGGPPQAHRIENISVTGFLMQSDDLWMPGTMIRMTIQKIGTRGDRRGDSITVLTRMVRRVGNGGAFEFILAGFQE